MPRMGDVVFVWVVFSLVWIVGAIMVGQSRRSGRMTVSGWMGAALIALALGGVFWTAADTFGRIVWFIALLIAWAAILWTLVDWSKRSII